MPRLTIYVTEKEAEMLATVCNSRKPRVLKSDVALAWHQSKLRSEYNRLPQSVLDNLKVVGDDSANA